MLVLSRKKAEQIRIGDNITITVLRVKGSAVQIGVDAPSHVKILRSELSFDPPAAPVQAAPAPAATNPPRETQPTARMSAVREEMGLLEVSRPIPAMRSERVTLADTLVFLG